MLDRLDWTELADDEAVFEDGRVMVDQDGNLSAGLDFGADA